MLLMNQASIYEEGHEEAAALVVTVVTVAIVVLTEKNMSVSPFQELNNGHV
jgi:hypothetical protein